MLRSLFTTTSLLLCTLLNPPCLGQSAGSSDDVEAAKALSQADVSPDTELAPADDRLGVSLSIDWTSAYYFRGIIQENQGVIVQPAAKLTYTLFSDDSSKLDLYVGTWHSFHDRATGAATTDDTIEHWYEADYYAGIAYTRGKWTFGASYIFYTSPSDAFDTIQEIDFTVGFDDSEYLEAFALHPYALLAIETGDDYTDGRDTQRGTYLEVGIAPGFEVDCGSFKLPITFPVSVGLSLDDYYEDAAGDSDTFGFAQVGVKTSVPLTFIEGIDGLTLNAGVSLLMLGDNTEEFNGGDGTEVIGTIGLSWSF